MSTSTHPGRLCRDSAHSVPAPCPPGPQTLGTLTVDMLRRGMPLTLLADLAWPTELAEVHHTHAA